MTTKPARTAGDGLMIGLEIHQRLQTGAKLFCNCSFDAARDSQAPVGGEGQTVFKFFRRLRAVSGELGQVDPAARFQAGKSNEIHYESPKAHACLVEEDEQTPNQLDQTALATTLKVALALNAAPVDEIHVMRKTVVDGSATGGFQRTALLALNGSIITESGSVGIQTVCLEEESANKSDAASNEGKVHYNLDRLGVPLVEIATEPDILGGLQAKQVALEIGKLLRNIGGMQRGIGTIRQDLNISITGGSRVEVKGVQDLAAIEKIVENEVERQKALLKIMQELQGVPQLSASKLPIISAAKAFGHGSSCAFIQKALDNGQQVMAVRLPGLGNFIGQQVMPAHRLGTEFSDYAKAAASVNGIIHSGEDLSKYPITQEQASVIASICQAGQNDAWALCVGPEMQGVKALGAVALRAQECWLGVPKETRRADGEKSRFMRPLPGSARMYPETDVPPVQVEESHLLSLRNQLPAPAGEQVKELVGLGLNEQIAMRLVEEGLKAQFFRIQELSLAEPAEVASVLLQELTALSREGVPVNSLTEEVITQCLKLLAQRRIARSALSAVLTLAATNPGQDLGPLIKKNKLEAYSLGELESIAKAYEGQDPKAAFGAIMRTHRLRVHADELIKILGNGKPGQPLGV
jgi:glutamyl-tRNA(Gln) amidotransferase subunit E